jgi:RHS repeat-associated protein
MVNTSGTVVNSYRYDEWGNILSQSEGVPNAFKYAGEMYDTETGFYYLRARYYDPSVGRFINKDTYKGQIDNPLSLNLYTYVHNNPLTNVDPTGHYCVSANGDWAHGGGCNSDTSYYLGDDKDFGGKPIIENGSVTGYLDTYGPFQSQSGNYWDMNKTDFYYVQWVEGDNNVYLNLDRNTQLELRKRLLQGYMQQQIDMGFPDLKSGMILGLTGEFGGLSQYPTFSDHKTLQGRSLPTTGNANSSADLLDEDGNVVQRRYFGPDGRAVKDIDFSDHGTPKQHPKVPHEHDWDWSKKPPRGKWK